MKTFKTKNLILNQITENDFNFAKFYLSDPERTRFLPLEKPYPEDEVQKWLANKLLHWEKHNFGSFIIQEKESRENIGFCGLEYARDTDFIDIRYGLIQDSWGKGYAFEAAFFCINEFGFEFLNLDVIYGAAVPENLASIYILKKLGMTPDSKFNCYGNVVDPYSIRKN